MKISWSSPEISVLSTLPRSVRQPPIAPRSPPPNDRLAPRAAAGGIFRDVVGRPVAVVDDRERTPYCLRFLDKHLRRGLLFRRGSTLPNTNVTSRFRKSRRSARAIGCRHYVVVSQRDHVALGAPSPPFNAKFLPCLRFTYRRYRKPAARAACSMTACVSSVELLSTTRISTRQSGGRSCSAAARAFRGGAVNGCRCRQNGCCADDFHDSPSGPESGVAVAPTSRSIAAPRSRQRRPHPIACSTAARRGGQCGSRHAHTASPATNRRNDYIGTSSSIRPRGLAASSAAFVMPDQKNQERK